MKKYLNYLLQQRLRLNFAERGHSASAKSAFDTLVHMRASITEEGDPEFRSNPEVLFAAYCARNLAVSRAQLFQDMFVLFYLGQKRDGYFVEFGATDGLTLSNSYVLEKSFGWTGILAEPGKSWLPTLKRNRSASIDSRCVWSRSGQKLEFVEADQGEYSTLSQFTNSDHLHFRRVSNSQYEVETVSLNDLLAEHRAPKLIDYLSIDTEGSEFEILSAFDFSKHSISIITVEHNYTENRQKIGGLLRGLGYLSAFPKFSKWDDWYVHSTVAQNFPSMVEVISS